MVFPISRSTGIIVQTWICTISGSFCVNLSFSDYGSWEEFEMPPTYFCDYLPFEDLALDLYNFKSPLTKDDCTKFDWNWLAGSGKDF
jgi:hypothetical protein